MKLILILVVAILGCDDHPAATCDAGVDAYVIHYPKEGKWAGLYSIKQFGMNFDFTYPDTFNYEFELKLNGEIPCNGCMCTSNMSKPVNSKKWNLDCYYDNTFSYPYHVLEECNFIMETSETGEGTCVLTVMDKEKVITIDHGEYNVVFKWLYPNFY
jgi:hypothetical protein